MKDFTVRQAATLLGVSDDTVRRWGESGRVHLRKSANGRTSIAGADLVAVMSESAAGSAMAEEFPTARSSSRNKLTGLVTRIQLDGVMAQVDLQAGPFRMVSLMSREAVEDLGLEVGMLAVASVKATTVSLELPAGDG
ncbi:MAG: TOBE domain-containing protein [Microbacterium sp.]